MPQATSPVPTKPALLTAYRVVAGVLSVLVIVQAVIAGQSEDLGYGDWSIVPHGILGNISFLLAVASLVLAIVTRSPRPLVGMTAVLVVLMTAQIGLGYSAATNAGAGAWHIPNGVAIFGLALYQQVLVRRVARDTPAGA